MLKSKATAEKKKRKETLKQLPNKLKYKNNKCFSSIPAVSFLFLTVSHSPPHLPRMLSTIGLVSGPVVGPAQTLIWFYSGMFLPLISTSTSASAFSIEGTLTVLLYIR